MAKFTSLHNEIPSQAGWAAIGELSVDPTILGLNNNGLLWNSFKERFQNEDMSKLKASLGYWFDPARKYNMTREINSELLMLWFPDLTATWEHLKVNHSQVAKNLVSIYNRYLGHPELSFIINASYLSEKDFVFAMNRLEENSNRLIADRYHPAASAWLYSFRFVESNKSLGYKDSDIFKLAILLTRAFAPTANIIHAQNFLKDEIAFMGELKDLSQQNIKISKVNLLFKTDFVVSEFNDLKDMPREWLSALKSLPPLETNLR